MAKTNGIDDKYFDGIPQHLVDLKSFEDAVNALPAKHQSFRVNLSLFNNLKTSYSPGMLINEIIKEINGCLMHTGSNSDVAMSIEESAVMQEEVCTFRIRTIDTTPQESAFDEEAAALKEIGKVKGPKPPKSTPLPEDK